MNLCYPCVPVILQTDFPKYLDSVFVACLVDPNKRRKCVCNPLKEHGCKHSAHTFYTQHIAGVIIIIAIIKENYKYKAVFYFLSPNVVLLFILKIAL